jgi:hypothetical protein
VDNVNSQGFDVSLAGHFFARNLRQKKKNDEAAENGHILKFVRSFSRLCHIHARGARAAHQAVTIKSRVCCVRVCNFSILACIIMAVASIYKIK